MEGKGRREEWEGEMGGGEEGRREGWKGKEGEGAYTCDVAVVPVQFASTVDKNIILLFERSVCAFPVREGSIG